VLLLYLLVELLFPFLLVSCLRTCVERAFDMKFRPLLLSGLNFEYDDSPAKALGFSCNTALVLIKYYVASPNASSSESLGLIY